MKKNKVFKIVIYAVVSLFILAYTVGANLLIEAALVPSFMEMLDAFQEITEKSYGEMIYTEDIQGNSAQALSGTKLWISQMKDKGGDAYQYLAMNNAQGYQLVAARFLQDKGVRESAPWVVMLHGYTGWKEEMFRFAMEYYNQGYNVLVPDMRCQGQSEGDFIGMGWTDKADNLLWINFILRDYPDAEIVLHGQSMGASAAIMLSADDNLPANVFAVVADCPYTDAYTMFKDKFRSWVGIRDFGIIDAADFWLKIRAGYSLKEASALEAIKKTSMPVLLIHGTEDLMISCQHSVRLNEAASDHSKLLLIEGAGHAQAPDKDPEAYYSAIWSFIADWR